MATNDSYRYLQVSIYNSYKLNKMFFIFIATANGVRLMRARESYLWMISLSFFSSSSFFYPNLWYSVTLFNIAFVFLDPTLLGLLRGDTSDWIHFFFFLNLSTTLSITFYSRVDSSPSPPLFSFWSFLLSLQRHQHQLSSDPFSERTNFMRPLQQTSVFN